ncbi:MAG: hypothetical protein JW751_07795 [Polyangiaceae bacterium]|nr:hypothetical protein [Polyangiaceae bacterium]
MKDARTRILGSPDLTTFGRLALVTFALALPSLACGSGGDRAGSVDDASGAAPPTGGFGAGGRSLVTGASGGLGGEGSGDGGSTTGGSTAGGSTTGGSTAGGSTAGGSTAGGTTPTLESCDPLDMTDWTPPAYVPARQAAVCSATEIADYYEQCLFGSDCARFEADGTSADCGACLEPSSPTDDTWGPVLAIQSPPHYVYLTNAGGCIDLMGESDCGAKIQTSDVCAREACTEPCTVEGALAFDAYHDCSDLARETVCAPYQAAAVCITEPEHSNACSGPGGFEALFIALATVHCGAE